MTSPTDTYLDNLARLAEAATPGEWEYHVGYKYHRVKAGETIIYHPYECHERHIEDAKFIAASREAVPRLIQLVRLYREALEGCSELHEEHCDTYYSATPTCDCRFRYARAALEAGDRLIGGEK